MSTSSLSRSRKISLLLVDISSLPTSVSSPVLMVTPPTHPPTPYVFLLVSLVVSRDPLRCNSFRTHHLSDVYKLTIFSSSFSSFFSSSPSFSSSPPFFLSRCLQLLFEVLPIHRVYEIVVLNPTRRVYKPRKSLHV